MGTFTCSFHSIDFRSDGEAPACPQGCAPALVISTNSPAGPPELGTLEAPPGPAPGQTLDAWERLEHARALGNSWESRGPLMLLPGDLPRIDIPGEVDEVEPYVPRPLHLQPRDDKGRWTPEAPADLAPDEQLSRELVRHGLRTLWAQAPGGGRSALARALGLRTRQDLACILRGNDRGFCEALRRRASVFLTRVARGELVLVKAGRTLNGAYPRMTWRRPSPGEHAPRPYVPRTAIARELAQVDAVQ